MVDTPSRTRGVHVTLDDLIGLRHRARGFSFLPHHPVRSLLAGRYGSRLRGRGLNFEEIRRYRPGDDIRSIDWKVTARTGKPYTRVYSEEKDRPVMVVLDQRQSMFFGSRLNMKSVTGAELGALALWKAYLDGDRPGCLVFDDVESSFFAPRRSRQTVSRIFTELVGYNTRLKDVAVSHENVKDAPTKLNTVLQQLTQHASHDWLYLVISDYQGFDQKSYQSIRELNRHNDIVLFLVHDPLALELPPSSTTLRFVGGDQRIEVDTGLRKIRELAPQVLRGRMEEMTKRLAALSVPLLPISCGEDTADQMARFIGLRAEGLL